MINSANLYNKLISLFVNVNAGFKFGDLKPLSYSQIDSYLTCPQKYELSYIRTVSDNETGNVAEASVGGGLAFYNILTRTLKESYKTGVIASLEEILSLYEKFWISSNFRDVAEELKYFEDGKRILNGFYEKNKDEKGKVAKVAGWKNKDEKFPALAQRVYLDIDGIKVSEKIDRIMAHSDGSFESVIYRMGRPFGQDLRPALFLMAVKKLFPFRRHKITYYFLRENKKVVCEISDATTAKFRETVKNVALGIIRQEFSPCKSSVCSFCDFRPSCSLWRGVLTDRARMRLSYSKYNMYLTCPRQYRFVYIDKVKLNPHSFFSIGTSIHEAFEKFYAYDGIFKKPGLNTLLGMLKDSWKTAGYAEDGVNEQEYYKKAVKMLEDYYKSFVAAVPYKRACKIEEYFELPIGKKALMTGFIDKIDELPDGNYEILDYKTEPKWPGDKIMEDHKLQLALYWWACKEGKITPIPPSALSLFMLQFDKKVTFYPQASGALKNDFSIDMDNKMREIVEKIDRTVDEIKSAALKYKSGSNPDEVFVPKRNDYCTNCDFRLDCPLFLTQLL